MYYSRLRRNNITNVIYYNKYQRFCTIYQLYLVKNCENGYILKYLMYIHIHSKLNQFL